MTALPGPPGPDAPDDLLLTALATGDEAAFRVLYRRHTPRLRWLVLRLLGGHEADTDDAVQEGWVRAVAGLRGFRGDSTFASWLSGIAIRVAWETIRRRRPWAVLEEGEESAIERLDLEERVDLEQALGRLPDPQRMVLVLHDIEGFTHDEIAAQLDMAEGTSKSHLHRARRALRAMLESHERVVE
jgi:RNA polymerase sigma-70 factor (ECF subfamily)